MTTALRLVQNDTPTINLVLFDKLTGAVVDVQSANVFFNFRKVGTNQVLVALLGVLLPGKVMPDGSINLTAPYNIPGRGGRVQITFADGDLNVPGGNYEAEVKAVFGGGSIATAFDPLNFLVRASF